MKNKILFGPPGCGKTFAAQSRAEEIGAAYVEHLFHSWTDDQEMFVGINVQAAVAGESENVRQEGVLLRAAKASLEGPTVLLLDELDKASEAVEYLLLQFLQDGLVPVAPGEYVKANLENLEVFIASNEVRDHHDALLRRCKRVFMNPISNDIIVDAMDRNSPLSTKLCKTVWKVAKEVSVAEGNESLSLQEGVNLANELASARSVEDVKEAFIGWTVRRREGVQEVQKRADKINTIWGLINSESFRV